MSKIIITNGYVVDPSTGIDGKYDIYIDGNVIEKVTDSEREKRSLESLYSAADVIDAAGLYVFPGFVDLHVHFREPGLEYKETIETGASAAAAGGVTTVCMMPNTKPVIDTPEMIKKAVEKAAKVSKIRVLPIGAITKGQNGKELTDIKGMKAAGACAISEDGKSVMSTELMTEAMTIAAECDIPVFDHCEDIDLVRGGVMNAGRRACELGLPGIENRVEEIIEARDVDIAAKTGARIHLCHCTTAGAVKIIEEAKERGINVTAETGPHYIALTDDDIPADFGNWKMNPPLRSAADKKELRRALSCGLMDCIATDHAPHGREEKEQSFLKAPFGIVGLETSFPVCYTELVKSKEMKLSELIERMSCRPARILRGNYGTLKAGAAADIAIFDLDTEYKIKAENFKSKGRNTPFEGYKAFGLLKYTIAGGQIVYDK